MRKSTLIVLLMSWLLVVSIVDGDENNDSSSKKYYYGDKVLRLLPTTTAQVNWLTKLYMTANSNFYDFWTAPRAINVPVDIHVSKTAFDNFCFQLKEAKLNYTVTIPDLQKLIDNSSAKSLLKRKRRNAQPNSIVGTFALFDDVIWYINSICSNHPKLASCGVMGKTFQGRDLHYVKLGTTSTVMKQEIFIEAGAHAREWLSPATVIYLMEMLVSTYDSDVATKKLLDTYDFIFVPVANPDGYEYSRLERMWRKTRSKSNTSICYGVDSNRNYDNNWGPLGSSDDSCSFIYRGPVPFSEPETKAISVFLSARKNRILAYFALHGYGQLWLIPYGNGIYSSDFSEMVRVADIGAEALMAVNDMKWEVGNTADILWPRSGCSEDWAKSIGIKYSYLLELRPLIHKNTNGFVVDEEEIEPSAREVWAGLVAAVGAMNPLFPPEPSVNLPNLTFAETKTAPSRNNRTFFIVIVLIVVFLICAVAMILIVKFILCKSSRGDEVATGKENTSTRKKLPPTTGGDIGPSSGANVPLTIGDEDLL